MTALATSDARRARDRVRDPLLTEESSPAGNTKPRPGNDVIYSAIADAVRRLVVTHPGERSTDPARAQLFTQNGGAIYYEVLPHALTGGLLEASTPECMGPSQVLLYQKAQESLLLLALPMAEEKLLALGWDGELGLIKNCRDGEDHVYGAQENYEVDIARGPSLFLYRLGLAAILPLIPFEFILFWSIVSLIFVSILFTYSACALLTAIFPVWGKKLEVVTKAITDDGTRMNKRLGYVSLWIECSLHWPLLAPFTTLLRMFAFRRIRKTSLSFIISRPILTGTGTVDREGNFGLSEKGPAMRRTIRTFVDPDNRPIFDTGNLMKGLMHVLFLRTRPLKRLFQQRQRLQLGFSDSNAAQVAEYLKVGTTSLVIEMAEKGLLDDAPRATDPVKALHEIVADPTLSCAVEIKNLKNHTKRSWTALELQRFYLERAREYVTTSPVSSLEAREIIRLWSEALDSLENNPEALVGRLDWVTKRFLIENAGKDLSAAARKKIDLRYHELGKGYLAEMERTGNAVVLVDKREAEDAIERPPEETPARVRGRLIKELAGSASRVTVSWDSVRIGGRVGGQVIRLDDYRNE